MKALIWIAALILAIPTFGISIAIAFVITIHINKQEKLVAAHIIISAMSSLKVEIVNKYYRLRMQEGLSPTHRTDSDIFNHVVRIYFVIEEALKESGRFHDEKDDVIQLAVRLSSYSEDFDSEIFYYKMKNQLVYIAQAGVTSALRIPYKNQNNLSQNNLSRF